MSKSNLIPISYYRDTMQHKAMKLMASKLAVAGIIEGNFTEEGLAAMSDVQDMTSQMAKELMLGIRDNVEDVAASFKKMAIVNPNRNRTQPQPKPAPPVPAEQKVMSEVAVLIPPRRTFNPETASQYAVLLEQQKPKRVKKTAVDENQMPLFDFVA